MGSTTGNEPYIMNINIVTEVVWFKIQNQIFDAARHRTRFFVKNLIKRSVLDHGLSEIELGLHYSMRRTKYAKSSQ